MVHRRSPLDLVECHPGDGSCFPIRISSEMNIQFGRVMASEQRVNHCVVTVGMTSLGAERVSAGELRSCSAHHVKNSSRVGLSSLGIAMVLDVDSE